MMNVAGLGLGLLVLVRSLCAECGSNDAFSSAWTADFDSTSSTTAYDRLTAEPSKPAVGTSSTGLVTSCFYHQRPINRTGVFTIIVGL